MLNSRANGAVVLIFVLLASLLGAGVGFVVTSQNVGDFGYSYLIGRLSDGRYYARSGVDGRVVDSWTSTNASAVETSAYAALTNGGSVNLINLLHNVSVTIPDHVLVYENEKPVNLLRGIVPFANRYVAWQTVPGNLSASTDGNYSTSTAFGACSLSAGGTYGVLNWNMSDEALGQPIYNVHIVGRLTVGTLNNASTPQIYVYEDDAETWAQLLASGTGVNHIGSYYNRVLTTELNTANSSYSFDFYVRARYLELTFFASEAGVYFGSVTEIQAFQVASDNQTIAYTPTITVDPTYIFQDGQVNSIQEAYHNFSAWTSTDSSGGSKTINALYPHEGSYSYNFTINAGEGNYAIASKDISTTTPNIRSYITFASAIEDASYVSVLQWRTGGENYFLRLHRVGVTYTWEIYDGYWAVYYASAAQAFAAGTTYCLEVDVVGSVAAGEIHVFRNNVEIITQTGLGMGGATTTEVRAEAWSSTGAQSAARIIYQDSFVVDDVHVGL